MNFEDRLLTAILERHETITAASSSRVPERASRWSPSHWGLVTAAAVLVGGVLTGVGVGIWSLADTAAPAKPAPGTVLDARVVATRTIRALDQLGSNWIQYTRDEYVGTNGARSTSASWTYGARSREEDYSGIFGAPSNDSSVTINNKNVAIGITVDYAHRVWFPLTYNKKPGAVMASTASYVVTEIRQGLRTGRFTVAGVVTVNGHKAIELISRPYHDRNITIRIWIDQDSYLPIQQQSSFPQLGTSTSEVSWLPPTQANLTLLTAPVPSGFTHLSSPPPYDS
jgi:hypothetical protein